jgi:hypothetical protein
VFNYHCPVLKIIGQNPRLCKRPITCGTLKRENEKYIRNSLISGFILIIEKLKTTPSTAITEAAK